MFDIGTIWLKLSYFFLSNRGLFKKWWFIALIALTIFSVIFAFTNVIIYLVGLPRENRMVHSIAASQLDYLTIRGQDSPKALEIGETLAVPSAVGKYDFIIRVTNPNQTWAARSVRYTVQVGDTATSPATDFIMPGAEKYFVVYSAAISGGSAQTKVTVEDVNWQRVPTVAGLPEVSIGIEDVQYSMSTTLETTAHRVTATVVNNGVVGFWRTKFVVILYNADRIVGINTTFIDQFKVGERRPLYVQWERLGGSVTKAEVIPDVDVLDAENLIT